MKKNYLLLFTLFSILQIQAQSYSLDWVNLYPNNTAFSISVIGEDSSGNILTSGRYTTTPDVDASYGQHLLTSNDSGFAATYISKISPVGNLLWAVGIKNPSIAVSLVVQHPSGSIIVVCNPQHNADSMIIENNNHELTSYPIPPNGAFLAKFSSNGNFLGFIKFNLTGSYPIFSIGDITFDKHDNLLISGDYSGTVDFDPSNGTQQRTSTSALFLLKIDQSGQFKWVQSYDSDRYSHAGSLCYDKNDNIIMTGYYNDSLTLVPGQKLYSTDTTYTLGGVRNSFLAKFDSAGTPLFAHSLNVSDLIFHDLACDREGNITLAGTFNDSLALNNTTTLFPYQNNNSVYGHVIQFDSTGALKWFHILNPTAGAAHYQGLLSDTSGNLFISGSTNVNTTLDLDPGPGNVPYTSNGSDFFIQKLDRNGNYLWSTGFGGNGLDNGLVNIIDSDGNLYLSGYFSDTLDFDPSSLDYKKGNSLAMGRESFLLKLKDCPSSTGQIRIGSCSPISFKGNTYTQSRFIMDTLTTTGSCDSTVRVELSIGDIDTTIVYRADSSLVSNQCGATSYQWVDCNDNFKPIQGATRNDFTPVKNGNYAVLITKDSCSAYSACYNYQVVSSEEVAQSAIQLFPNPVNNKLTIDFSTAFEGTGQVKIYDLSGILVNSYDHISEPSYILDFSNLPSGIYLVKARSGTNTISAKVIRH